MARRRSYATGSLFVRADARGREAWYGKWYSGGRQIKRKLGPKRAPGSRDGLTLRQAERELQRRMESDRPPVAVRLSLPDAASRYLDHLEHVLERKRTTVSDYRYMLNGHLEPFFRERAIEQINAGHVASYTVAK